MTSNSAVEMRPSSPSEALSSILKPGRNCWRIARAHRAAVLTNGGYFRVLAASMAAAERLILVLGWDLDARLVLDPRGSGAVRLQLHEFLRHLLRARPELEIRFLIWDRPFLYGGNRRASPVLEAVRGG